MADDADVTDEPRGDIPLIVGRDVPRVCSTVPHSARMWDYWLGGKDNYEVDRDMIRAGLPRQREEQADIPIRIMPKCGSRKPLLSNSGTTTTSA
jgi:hypothetical protein